MEQHAVAILRCGAVSQLLRACADGGDDEGHGPTTTK